MMDRTPILKAVFLVLAILFFLGFISLQAFAAEKETRYQDTGMIDGLDGEEIPPGDLGEKPVSSDLSEMDFLNGDIPAEGFITLLDHIAAIREGTELFLYFIIPCFCAVLAVYKFYTWFYSTFIESVL